MATLTELLAEKADIESQIARLRQEERVGAITKIRALMAEHGLSVADLTAKQPPKAREPSVRGKVAPKYRDPISGATWTGRGLKPKWMQVALDSGKTLAELAA